MNKVYIIGTGAVGILLASKLMEKNIETTLIRSSRDDIKLLEENYKIIDGDGKSEEFSIMTGSITEFANLNGILVVTAKAFGNPAIARKLKKIEIKGPLVIMQNGLGVEQVYLDTGFDQVYRCVLYVTSQVVGPREIRYKPVNISRIGVIKGDNETLKQIVETLNTENFQFAASNEIEKLAWQKAILNSVFNSILPLINIDNGIFTRNEEVFDIAKELIQEILQVTDALGIDLDQEQLVSQVLHISNASNGQLISTLQDINARRLTEIDSLNLAISEIAKNLNPPIEVPKTQLLGQLIKLRSQNY